MQRDPGSGAALAALTLKRSHAPRIPLQPAPESGKLLKRSTGSDVAKHLCGLWRRMVSWTVAYA